MSKVRDFNLFSDIFILNFILLQNMFILKKISNIFKLKFIYQQGFKNFTKNMMMNLSKEKMKKRLKSRT